MSKTILHDVRSKQHLYGDKDGVLTMSSDFMADIVMHRLKPTWRFEPLAKQWYHFDGKRWKVSHSAYAAVIEEGLIVKASLRGGCQNLDKASDSGFAKTVQGKIEASADIQITPDQFDKDPWISNTPSGPVDLRTGRLDEPNAELLCFQATSVSPEDDEDGKKCPNYLKHLKFVSNNDKDLSDYLEALAGYFLTGDTTRQEFYSLWGRGDNGKSALALIWTYCFGDYATEAAVGQFGFEGENKHPEQDMRLIGKRLVVAEESGSWDTAKLKRWTSGGKVVAREMHGKSTSFSPQCKLIFISNKKPKINGADYGLQRRLRLVELTNQLTKKQKDERFVVDKLQPEAPFILNRMIKAAGKYIANPKGLVTPKVVLGASKEYFNSQDVIGSFIGRHCKKIQGAQTPLKDIITQLEVFCKDSGFDVPVKNSISNLFAEYGYKSETKGARAKVILGISLKTADEINEDIKAEVQNGDVLEPNPQIPDTMPADFSRDLID